MEQTPKNPVPTGMDGDDSKQVDPAAAGTSCFYFREYQHLDFFERMMLSGLCLFQIPFSLMVFTVTSSKKPSMISPREKHVFILFNLTAHYLPVVLVVSKPVSVSLPISCVVSWQGWRLFPLFLFQHLANARQRVGAQQMTTKLK